MRTSLDFNASLRGVILQPQMRKCASRAGARCVEIIQEIVRDEQARRDSLLLPSRRRKINIIAIVKAD